MILKDGLLCIYSFGTFCTVWSEWFMTHWKPSREYYLAFWFHWLLMWLCVIEMMSTFKIIKINSGHTHKIFSMMLSLTGCFGSSTSAPKYRCYWLYTVVCWSLSFHLSQYYSFFQRGPPSNNVTVCEKDLGWRSKEMLLGNDQIRDSIACSWMMMSWARVSEWTLSIFRAVKEKAGELDLSEASHGHNVWFHFCISINCLLQAGWEARRW